MSAHYWHDKVAIVTGASSGLGRDIARAFAASGARVVLAARGAEALQATAHELSASGATVLAVPTDVTVADSAAALVAQTLERFGQLDVLVNNAGRSMRRAVHDTTAADFGEQFEINVQSTVNVTLAAIEPLLARRGHLVNIASLAGLAPARYMGAYGPSKAALVSYTRQLRLELADRGLNVLLVCPGPIARDKPREYTAAELAGLPPSAAKPGGGVKAGAIRPEALAAAILRAAERRQKELVVPGMARVVLALSQLSPSLGDWLIRKLG
ncbi:MAG: SDR family oxidoreductase [Planctomycetes bacterium]|nr:SDR family oxidoreductase [Planctomycetota bacterium]